MTGRARILVVDDDPGVRDLLAFVLDEAGFEVEVAATAAAAGACLDSIRYDVVIADWWLPDRHGLAVVDEAADRGAKTFVLSGYDLRLIDDAATRHGLLKKPIDPAELLAAVRQEPAGRVERNPA